MSKVILKNGCVFKLKSTPMIDMTTLVYNYPQCRMTDTVSPCSTQDHDKSLILV
ncbi:hypothetical protein KHQ81_14510 [Mycoplasmatota bacterium]|nr:hypothetical protein KHQ81_14510 [Mycoplasmatota bacterium]